jgi:hypothetical protein
VSGWVGGWCCPYLTVGPRAERNYKGGGCLIKCTSTATFVVGNRYKDRTQDVMAHSDSLALLGPRPIIAGLSFGGEGMGGG